jgi:hypothetical protein
MRRTQDIIFSSVDGDFQLMQLSAVNIVRKVPLFAVAGEHQKGQLALNSAPVLDFREVDS